MQKLKFRDWLLGKDTNDVTKDNWIKEKLSEIENGKSILDAGAGELKWKPYCAHLKYTSQDFAQYDGTVSNIGLQSEDWTYPQIDIVSDITNIPVPDESFDVVLCSEVFEHLSNPNAALQELVRITKRGGGGTLLLTAPFCSVTHMAPYHFCTGFNQFWYKENLEKLGCTVEECVANGDFYDCLRQEVIRMPFVTKKYKGHTSLYMKVRCAMFAHFLKKYISTNDNSDELACFGYMIVAKRN